MTQNGAHVDDGRPEATESKGKPEMGGRRRGRGAADRQATRKLGLFRERVEREGKVRERFLGGICPNNLQFLVG